MDLTEKKVRKFKQQLDSIFSKEVFCVFASCNRLDFEIRDLYLIYFYIPNSKQS